MSNLNDNYNFGVQQPQQQMQQLQPQQQQQQQQQQKQQQQPQDGRVNGTLAGANVVGTDSEEKVQDEEKCYNCGGAGHFARECNSARGSVNFENAPPCHNCQGKGHFSRVCPTRRHNLMRQQGCYVCMQFGHRSFECPFAAMAAAGYMGGRGAGPMMGMASGRGAPMGRGRGRGGFPAPGFFPPGMGAGMNGMGPLNAYGFPVPMAPYGFNGGMPQMGAYGYPMGVPPGMGRGRGRGACFVCNQVGHFGRDCPQKAAPVS